MDLAMNIANADTSIAVLQGALDRFEKLKR
jgi:hypothetical protein